MSVTVDHAARVVERYTHRLTALVRTGLAPEQPVVGSTWTVRQLVAHLASGAVAYREIAEGQPSPYRSLDERAALNEQRLQDELGRDLVALADVVDAEIAVIVGHLRSRQADEGLAWHGGIELGTVPFLGAIAGEMMFHGLDLARTTAQEWPLARQDAVVAVEFFNAVTPHVVDTVATGALSAVFEVRSATGAAACAGRS